MNVAKWCYKHKKWVAIFIVNSLVIVLTIWVIILAPQHMLRFALAPIFSILLLTILLISQRKHRARLRERFMQWRIKTERRDSLLFRYGKICTIVMVIALTVFFLVVVSNPAIFEIPYIPHLLAALFIAFLFSFVAFISGFLKRYGKWGLVIIGLATALAVLRIILKQL